MKERNAQIGLGILYTVGIAGYLSPLATDFTRLTPLNLLITIFAALYFHPNKNATFVFTCGIIYVLSFGAEMIGINTGILFGNYSYGGVLGFQFLNTPLLIGINWLMLAYTAAAVCNNFFARTEFKILNPFFSALLMVSLDVLIEPVAQKYNLWHWQEGFAPFKNYLHWFLISLFIQYLIYFTVGLYQNQTARIVFYLQFIFFFILFQFVK